MQSIESSASAVVRISSKSVKWLIKLCEKLESLETVSDEEWCSAFTAEQDQMGRLICSLAPGILWTLDGDRDLFKDAKSQEAAYAQQCIFCALANLFIEGLTVGTLLVSESRSHMREILLPRDLSFGLREFCSWFLNLA
jgi:hypothetical protein